ncbi:MAG TPA: YhjD/YihY/BrkB family envelope integrity protein [Solirubrobacteraceae bacterium]|nr:YhjD/YihY/BrkB family envelope integrity protein [Solirubrobacteraceae bacterium]
MAAEGIIEHPERRAAGPVVQALLTFVIATIFFYWTMHFLLDGRVPWRRLVRPALVTALLWVALAVFSSLYFSTTVIDDSKTYGTIGVVFTFLTWFILVGSVIVLGAACGACERPEAAEAPSRLIPAVPTTRPRNTATANPRRARYLPTETTMRTLSGPAQPSPLG